MSARALIPLAAMLAAAAACSPERTDLETACMLGLVATQTVATEAQIQTCADRDEAILATLPGASHDTVERCIGCVSSKHIEQMLCFIACGDDGCASPGLSECSDCDGPSMAAFCARGGQPAEHAAIE